MPDLCPAGSGAADMNNLGTAIYLAIAIGVYGNIDNVNAVSAAARSMFWPYELGMLIGNEMSRSADTTFQSL
jgi:hypothetical protein